MKENRDLWDAWSDDFQAAWNADTGEGELPPARIHYGPGFPEDERLALLPAIEGADVVELGYGGGQASVGFARQGAESVVGVDFSTEQLGHAIQLRDTYDVEGKFVVGDVTALPLADDAFDLAFSSWAFQMVGDVEACFAEAARVLREDGAFVFSIPHPFYELFDLETHELEFSYHPHDRRRLTIDDDFEPDMTVFNRKVGTIHDALVDAGFVVERLLEPGTDDPDDYRENMSNVPELMAMVPRTLVVRAVVG